MAGPVEGNDSLLAGTISNFTTNPVVKNAALTVSSSITQDCYWECKFKERFTLWLNTFRKNPDMQLKSVNLRKSTNAYESNDELLFIDAVLADRADRSWKETVVLGEVQNVIMLILRSAKPISRKRILIVEKRLAHHGGSKIIEFVKGSFGLEGILIGESANLLKQRLGITISRDKLIPGIERSYRNPAISCSTRGNAAYYLNFYFFPITLDSSQIEELSDSNVEATRNGMADIPSGDNTRFRLATMQSVSKLLVDIESLAAFLWLSKKDKLTASYYRIGDGDVKNSEIAMISKNDEKAENSSSMKTEVEGSQMMNANVLEKELSIAINEAPHIVLNGVTNGISEKLEATKNELEVEKRQSSEVMQQWSNEATSKDVMELHETDKRITEKREMREGRVKGRKYKTYDNQKAIVGKVPAVFIKVSDLQPEIKNVNLRVKTIGNIQIEKQEKKKWVSSNSYIVVGDESGCINLSLPVGSTMPDAPAVPLVIRNAHIRMTANGNMRLFADKWALVETEISPEEIECHFNFSVKEQMNYSTEQYERVNKQVDMKLNQKFDEVVVPSTRSTSSRRKTVTQNRDINITRKKTPVVSKMSIEGVSGVTNSETGGKENEMEGANNVDDKFQNNSPSNDKLKRVQSKNNTSVEKDIKIVKSTQLHGRHVTKATCVKNTGTQKAE